MSVSFSIIIPHRDCPDLLQRCLDSIPACDDVQVIVVDDNSDDNKVDFRHFPQWNGKNYELVFTKEGRGAGYARNIGMVHAEGDWLIFADADDLFTDKLKALFCHLEKSKADIVYFGIKSVLSDDLTTPSDRVTWNKEYISALLNHERNAENNIRVRWVVPSGKAFRKNLIETNSIRFDEVRWSNDIVFSISAAVKARTISAFNEDVYLLTERTGSLTANFCGTLAEASCRLSEAIKYDRIVVSHGCSFPWKPSTDIILNYVWKNKGIFFWNKWFFHNLFRPTELFCIARFSLRTIKRKGIKQFKKRYHA